ncbi:hypothetical protein L1049_014045 [Liquidambar formosana]|uniref:Uncharacterized protein n=1 Tax=Liquidambar formosana TaxID=63359 RepID=A0AAP0RLC6_LIQFO
MVLFQMKMSKEQLKSEWFEALDGCREKEKEKEKATGYILRTELERREKKVDFRNHVIQQLQLLRNERDHFEDKIHHIKWSLKYSGFSRCVTYSLI